MMSSLQVMEYLNKGWLSTAVGALGIFIGVALYLLSKRTGAPVYQIYSTRLIGHLQQLPAEIVISAFGRKVTKLAKVAIVFWNGGTKTVNGSDIVVADPLRVEFAETAEILQAAMVSTTREAIGAAVNVNP